MPARVEAVAGRDPITAPAAPPLSSPDSRATPFAVTRTWSRMRSPMQVAGRQKPASLSTGTQQWLESGQRGHDSGRTANCFVILEMGFCHVLRLRFPRSLRRGPNLAVNLGIYGFGSCFFGLPPFRPLMRDCSLPASDFGPVLNPPCHLQRPPK